LLQDEYCINVLDYNWFPRELRARCISLVQKIVESEKIYEFACTKCSMVYGIYFASDLFVNKAYELENELKHNRVHANMVFILRYLVQSLKLGLWISYHDTKGNKIEIYQALC
jgi:hypothetical protein